MTSSDSDETGVRADVCTSRATRLCAEVVEPGGCDHPGRSQGLDGSVDASPGAWASASASPALGRPRHPREGCGPPTRDVAVSPVAVGHRRCGDANSSASFAAQQVTNSERAGQPGAGPAQDHFTRVALNGRTALAIGGVHAAAGDAGVAPPHPVTPDHRARAQLPGRADITIQTGRIASGGRLPPSRTRRASTAYVEPYTLTMEGAVAWSGMSRTRIEALLSAKLIRGVRAGRRTLVIVASLRDYLDALPPAR